MSELIYRVQDSEGYGPYYLPGSVVYSDKWIVNSNHIAPMYDSFEKDLQEGEVCGFKTVEQAREWFNDEMLKVLIEDANNEWFIAVYEIPSSKVRHGMVQVLAMADSMVFKGMIPLSYLVA